MAKTAIAQAPLWEPRVIKISSKRQITIPADVYESAGFAEYALVSWAEGGFTVQPVDVRDEDTTVRILRHLLAAGYDGEELIDEYEKINKKMIKFEQLVEEGVRDADEGRVMSYSAFRKAVRDEFDV